MSKSEISKVKQVGIITDKLMISQVQAHLERRKGKANKGKEREKRQRKVRNKKRKGKDKRKRHFPTICWP